VPTRVSLREALVGVPDQLDEPGIRALDRNGVREHIDRPAVLADERRTHVTARGLDDGVPDRDAGRERLDARDPDIGGNGQLHVLGFS
jgi:hypothetical protein